MSFKLLDFEVPDDLWSARWRPSSRPAADTTEYRLSWCALQGHPPTLTTVYSADIAYIVTEARALDELRRRDGYGTVCQCITCLPIIDPLSIKPHERCKQCDGFGWRRCLCMYGTRPGLCERTLRPDLSGPCVQGSRKCLPCDGTGRRVQPSQQMRLELE